MPIAVKSLDLVGITCLLYSGRLSLKLLSTLYTCDGCVLLAFRLRPSSTVNEKDLDKMTADDQIENFWIEAFGSVDSDHNLDAPSFEVNGTPSTPSPPTSRNQRFYLTTI